MEHLTILQNSYFQSASINQNNYTSLLHLLLPSICSILDFAQKLRNLKIELLIWNFESSIFEWFLQRKSNSHILPVFIKHSIDKSKSIENKISQTEKKSDLKMVKWEGKWRFWGSKLKGFKLNEPTLNLYNSL